MTMTKTIETTWNECQRPDWMLERLEHVPCDQSKLRLLACDFVRHTPLADGRKVWDLLTDERSRNAVEVAERYAVGKATDEELSAAWYAARDAARAAADAAAFAAARAAQCDMVRARFTADEILQLVEGEGR